MADIDTKKDLVIEVAQAQKKPVLPARPSADRTEQKEPDEKLIRSSAGILLSGEEKVEKARKEFKSLFFNGGTTKEKASEMVKQLRSLFDAADTLMRVYPDLRAAQGLIYVRSGLESLFKDWSDYRPGPGWPTLNPFNWTDADRHAEQITTLKAHLNVVEMGLRALKPYLREWAAPPLERPHFTGPIDG